MSKSTRITSWKADILTLFPEAFKALGHSITGRAIGTGRVVLNIVDIRGFATDNYKSVDDAPYGGGAGQVMRPDVLGRALESVVGSDGAVPIFCLSPRGERFTQKTAEDLASQKEVAFVCGHYEGIDQRAIEYYGMRELSIGDFVTSGGEVALLPIIDSVARLIPGVLGSEESLRDESFGDSLGGGLEYPQYTRPETWNGIGVPEVLLSGHHKKIEEWRKYQSSTITRSNRPDLMRKEKP
ncbi:MAG: tRNA (guanosine(37)-N1)-methyltransferase TrmD [Rickettsiales bacterium]|jgi:tRNA (guanine37-N1)-methyltransferase|nr:tRNA (guanosine(37)-N1)-methyltransferase TrmD [Rickettsiales bacterium]